MKAGKRFWSGVWAVLLAACSASPPSSETKTLDADALEDQIRAVLNEGGIPVVRVSCPPGRELRRGDTFDCSAEDAEGRPVMVQVEQTDASGTVFIQTTTLYAPGVEDWIEKGNGTRASCPDGEPSTDGEGEIECTALVGGKEVTLLITVVANKVTSVVEKGGTGGAPDPSCADLWSGGADAECDACAAQKCCDELVACVSGTPCARYSLCERSCPPGDEACIQATCGDLGDGKADAEAVRGCMAACPASCSS